MVIASAVESDAAIVCASSAGTKCVTSSDAPTTPVTSAGGTANRVASSDESVGDEGGGVGSGVSGRTVSASSTCARPHCGQRSTAGGMGLPQNAHVVADCAARQPPGL